MKVLAVNHFFEQDLHVLQAFAPQHEVRAIPYAWIRELSTQIFPDENYRVFESYSEPGFAEREQVWDERMRPLIEHVRARFPFEIVILPSDAIFYLRVLVRWCQRNGVPCVVTQKETSITDATMQEYAAKLRDHLPFHADHMTINSERHKSFWVSTGADPESITVTGQPRFDDHVRVSEAERRPGPPRILFLSYVSTAYLPITSDLKSWSQLHTESLEVLAEAARTGAEVVVKPHPQQDEVALQEVRDARARLGDCDGSFELVGGRLDTRKLIHDADVVVGFQTTALYEAVIAGKPVIYTNWTVPPDVEPRLLDYEGFGEALVTVRTPQAFRDALVGRLDAIRAGTPPPAMDPGAKQHAEFQLGPLDGKACERTWHVLESRAGQAPAVAPPSTPRALGRRKLAHLCVRVLHELGGRKNDRLRATRFRLRNEIKLLGEIPLVEGLFG
tara:strand:- start:1260 stop:2597 length:1338 start_codon:yes stop_codon:yes gene_type:complete